MSYFQAIVLAIIQGLTEFLPVSSSGHLVIAQHFFGLQPPVIFDILVHVGTLGAIVFYFRRELKVFCRPRLFWLLVIGSLPAGIVGLFLQTRIEVLFSSLQLVGVSLALTSLLLFSTKFAGRGKIELRSLNWSKALIVGFLQALAVLPGISRSGATITAGLWCQFKPQTAFHFSFFLAIPAIIGALILQIPDLIAQPSFFLVQGFLGMVIAGGVGYITLKSLETILVKAKFWAFGFYCLIAAIILLT